jgi:hypothetical protein
MKRALFTLYILFLGNQAFCQAINWNETKNWKLYSVFANEALNYSLDSIDRIISIPLSNDTIQIFLSNCEAWPKDKSSFWMSAYLCTYELGGKMRKITISNYGGFFFDYETKQYYQIKEELKDEWLSYFLNKGKNLMAQLKL